MRNEPIVSIICISYNHEKYIRQCLDGFLMQKASFPFEILVIDDGSTDGTQSILHDYLDTYPEKICVKFNSINHYLDNSCGKWQPIVDMLNQAKGKYLAFCEGDDFWFDDNKLQKQIEYLEHHSEYYALYHNVNIIDHNNMSVFHGCFSGDLPEHECDLKRFSREGKIEGHLSSLVCRNFWNSFSDNIKNLFNYSDANGDQLLYTICCTSGRVLYLETKMSTYRHITVSGTSWSARTKNKNMLLFRYKAIVAIKEFLKEWKNVVFDCSSYLDRITAESIYICIKNKTSENINIRNKIIKMNKRYFTVAISFLSILCHKVFKKVLNGLQHKQLTKVRLW